MCGIVGYVGEQDAAPLLLDGLARLEYRGYDSVGVAVTAPDGSIQVRKMSGRVDALRHVLGNGGATVGSCGIAHTRWATHGPPTERNAHPHCDCTGRIAVVHNGIIENAEFLRDQLTYEGHVFSSDTDTEVLAHLIERSTALTLEGRLRDALRDVEGSFGLAVLDASSPGMIGVARRGSPVLLGIGDHACFVASDVSAVIEHTRSVVYLDDGDIAVLRQDGYFVLDKEDREQQRPVDAVAWDIDRLALDGHEHYMRKEIHEQPETIAQTLRGRLVHYDGDAHLDGLNIDDRDVRRFRRVVIIGCGTSWHAGLVGRHLIEQLAGVPVDVEVGSEFRYRRRLPLEDTLTLAISQSGETADTLEAMRAARAAGSFVVGLVNVEGSTIARETDGCISLRAGPEIGVASTKAFTSQVVALALLGLFLGRRRGLSREEGRHMADDLERLAAMAQRTLLLEPTIRTIAEQHATSTSALFLGRGVSVPAALEGALKLKEVSYVHAEGYPAAEMKHGPIALIDAELPVIFVAPRDDVYAKSVANMEEVKARGGRLVAITSEGNGDVRRLADWQLCIPATPSLLSPVLSVIPLQLLAYHAAVLRGCDVDRPRNLAKSVTVE